MEQQASETCHKALRVEMVQSQKYLEVKHQLQSNVNWQYTGNAQAKPQWTVTYFKPSTELYIVSMFFFYEI